MSAKVVARVSGDGHRLTRWSGGSYVDLSFGTGTEPLTGCERLGEGSHWSLVTTRVSRDGWFRFAKRGRFPGEPGLRVSVQAVARLVDGRLTGRLRARLRSGQRGLCDSGWLALRGRHIPDPPFNGCRAQRARTLARTRSARMFVQRGRDDYVERVALVYGCLFSRNQRVLLGEDTDPEYFDLPRIAGPFAAFEASECPLACSHAITVIDLRSAATVSDLDLVELAAQQGVSNNAGFARALILKADGAVAFSFGFSTQPVGPPTAYEIVADDHAGQRVLDVGPGIRPRSLSLTGSTLTWRTAPRSEAHLSISPGPTGAVAAPRLFAFLSRSHFTSKRIQGVLEGGCGRRAGSSGPTTGRHCSRLRLHPAIRCRDGCDRSSAASPQRPRDQVRGYAPDATN